MKRWALATAIALGSVAGAVAAAPLEGTVVHVVDGDTFVMKVGDGQVTVRLQGIDAPEICQPHGDKARQALVDQVLDQPVQVHTKARDTHGRTVGKVMKAELDVGERLVRDGHAWSHRFKHDRGPYVAQERMARALSRGLHADGQAIPPREFRKRHGNCPQA